ncbi:TRAP transporter substrate-binding protein DctP [Roseibium sp.]|uniref:TRAP transporter substrate-binding protein DctP n=1 Tax=Roseibium sp. TaxID=1936156 RepID=UPI003A97D483
MPWSGVWFREEIDLMKRVLGSALLAAGLLCTTGAFAEETLRGISALPKNNIVTQSFLDYVEMVNAAGKGIVRIDVVGGPEALPANQQDTALRNGVIDIQSGPAGYYSGVLPESEAFTGATVTAAEARKNGAFNMMKKAWRDRLGAELLAWNGAGIQYYIYLATKPRLDEAGNIDLKGVKLRSVGTYRDWFDALGAQNIMLQQSEVFTALERGVVDGFGWITFVSDIGVNSLLKARIGPAVWQGSPVIMMNAERYDALSPEAQKILQDASIELEAKMAAKMPERNAHEAERLKADGVELVELEPAAARQHVKLAQSVVWDKLNEVVPAFAAEIRPLLYPEN